MGNLRDDELVTDLNVTINYLQNQFPRTRGQKIGIVGYCVGGRITYLAATSCPGLSAASVYYGGRILAPFGDGPAPVDLTHQIQIPVMGNFGALDANPAPDDVAQIEAKLKEGRRDLRLQDVPRRRPRVQLRRAGQLRAGGGG